MKPQQHTFPENWRNEDTALRRAVQQRNEALPQLPEGFAEKMMAQLPTQPAASPETPMRPTAHQRALWPWITVAVAAALIGVAVMIERPSGASPNSSTINRPTPNASHQGGELASAIKDSDYSKTSAPLRPVLLASAEKTATKKEAAKEEAFKKPASKKEYTVGTTTTASSTEPALKEPAVNTAEGSMVGGSSADTPPSTPSLFAQPLPSLTGNEGIIELTKSQVVLDDRGITPTSRTGKVGGGSIGDSFSSSSSSPLQLTLNFSPTAAGADLAMADDHFADTGNEDVISAGIDYPKHTHNEGYYLPAGEGYTYEDTYTPVTDGEDAANEQKAPHISTARRHAPAQTVNSTNHRLPLTLSAQLNIPLTQRLALETGLSYTRLSSTSDYGHINDYEHTLQTLHYIGMPLHLHYAFVARKRWRLYGLAGAEVDFPVAANRQQTNYTPNGSNATVTHHISAPVQFAPVVGLGVQLNLNEHAALFVQPSMQWFVPTGSSIETYRTEHPLTFALPFGFRWTL